MLLGFLTLVHGVTSVLWLRADTHVDMGRVPDDFAHYWGMANLHAAISIDALDGTVNGLRVISSYYPLLAQLPRALTGLLLGPSPLVFRAANVIYFVVLVASVYGIGRRCHGRRAGLLAAALVSLMPAVYGGARTMGLDYPSLCMTALAMLALLRVDGFVKPGRAVVFGFCAGLAILTKGQSALFLIWPAAVVLGRAVWSARAAGAIRMVRPLAGGVLSVAAVLATTAVWWGGRAGELVQIMGAHTTGEGMLELAGDITLWGGVLHFVKALPLVLSAPLALGLLLLLPVFWARAGRHRWTILAWLVLPLLLHMVLSVRHPRYIFPLVPAAAVLLAVGLCSLRPRLRAAGAAILGVLGVAAWITCSVGPRAMRRPPGAPYGPEHTVDRALCFEQVDLWQGRQAETIASVTDVLLSCGSCEYAGPPSPPIFLETVERAARLTAVLQQQSADGEGMLLYTDGIYRAVQSMVMVRAAMPRLLFLDVLYARDLLSAAPHGYRRYVLWDAKGGPPCPGATRQFAAPLTIELARDMTLEVKLWRLPETSGWPHAGSPD